MYYCQEAFDAAKKKWEAQADLVLLGPGDTVFFIKKIPQKKSGRRR
jgi:hypothetical protein